MHVRLFAFLRYLVDAAWLVPALMVIALAALGHFIVDIQRSGLIPAWLNSEWTYGGGQAGARTLLGAIATSTIAVAGTTFSITIAALTLASRQMGPRLLRNFMRDRGIQITLGIFLGAFAYCLMVLRSVNGGEDDAFVPALGVTAALILAGGCIATLVYFVHHVAASINVNHVIDLVSTDLERSIARHCGEEPGPAVPHDLSWHGADEISDDRSGYLQHVDTERLARWACERRATIRLLVRPGDFVYPGATVALMIPGDRGVGEVLKKATALGPFDAASDSLTHSIRQLVEIAVRALSSGTNDPLTAIAVLDRLGAAMTRLSRRHLPSGAVVKSGRCVVVLRALDYDDVADAMFTLIRQAAAGSPAVLTHMLATMRTVAELDERRATWPALRCHAEAVAEQGQHRFGGRSDGTRLDDAYRAFLTTASDAPDLEEAAVHAAIRRAAREVGASSQHH